MGNRIRHYRRLRGLKLRELAEAIGTTPQSVSRLETGHMTLSLDWLNRIAEALGVHPGDLIEESEPRGGFPLLGQAGVSALVEGGALGEIDIYLPIARPVAVRLMHPLGAYRAGEIVVGDRRPEVDLARLVGRDAVLATRDGKIYLARIAPPGGDRGPFAITLDMTRVLEAGELDWVAPVLMSVRFF